MPDQANVSASMSFSILAVFGPLQLRIKSAQLREFLIGWLKFLLTLGCHFLLMMIG